MHSEGGVYERRAARHTHKHTYTLINMLVMSEMWLCIPTSAQDFFPKNVTSVCPSTFVLKMRPTFVCIMCSNHEPYVSYVASAYVYSHTCPGICPKNVTNFCGSVLHASVVATVVRIPRSEVTLHVIGREAGCGWSPRFV